MLKKYTGKDFIIILLISFAAAIILHLAEMTILTHYFFHTDKADLLKGFFSAPDMLIRIAISSSIAFLLFLFNFEILNSFPGLVNSKIRAFIISPVLTFFLSSFLFHFISHMHFRNSGADTILEGIMIISPLKYMFLTIVVVFSSNIISINKHKKNILLENEKLRAENIQSKYEALRSQLNPHFLFNSLNALNLLIRENPASALEYVERLSEVLRYTLKSSEENLVPLSEELEFTNSYIRLLKTRYEENIIIDVQINPVYASCNIPPLSLQLLIENAVKHNIISKNSPLQIQITSTENKNIIVKNNLAPKLTAEEKSGTGLANLSKRYQLITGKEINITNDTNSFSVEIPVIEKL